MLAYSVLHGLYKKDISNNKVGPYFFNEVIIKNEQLHNLRPDAQYILGSWEQEGNDSDEYNNPET